MAKKFAYRVDRSRVPAVSARHVALVGLRNVDDEEKRRIRESGIHVFTMKDVDRLGITEVMERALVIAGRGTGGIHVSFDLDVCDPAIAPGVGTPVRVNVTVPETVCPSWETTR